MPHSPDRGLRRKLTLRAHGRTLVMVKKPRESMEHVLTKACLWALYLPQYPDLQVERPIGDRFKPDVVALDDTDRPVFWPRGADAEEYYQQAVDRLGDMAAACAEAGVIYLLEPEPNLVGYNSDMMLRLAADVGSAYLLINPDAANMHVQGYDAYDEYRKVAEAGRLGFMHIKDYTEPCPHAIAVDEEALKYFGSVDVGIAGHERILADLAARLPAINAQLRVLGADGLVLDVEGHMKGGGQFGGWSGPDGLGVAVRALVAMLQSSGIDVVLRQYGDIRKK